ncbi:MAG: hypothetical protein AB7D47_00750 [Desulfovibrio sp.]
MAGKRILFRTCAGGRHGWGNLVRLASFAAYCRDRGGHAGVFVLQGPPEAEEYLRRRRFAVHRFEDGEEETREARLLERCGPADLAVMEMLDCGPVRQRLLACHASRVVVFDDLMDHEYVGDLVVCGQALPDYGNQALAAPETHFLTGPEYFLLDPRFQNLPLREEYGELRRIVVAFGGGAYDVALLKAALALKGLGHDDPTVVLGYAATDMAARLRALLPHARVLHGVDDMAGCLRQHDLALVSAGYLKIEAAAAGTPAVMLATQWHQIPLGEEFTRLCGMPFAGYMSFVRPETLQQHITALRDPERRRARAEAARACVDGQGMRRVYDAMDQLFRMDA